MTFRFLSSVTAKVSTSTQRAEGEKGRERSRFGKGNRSSIFDVYSLSYEKNIHLEIIPSRQ